MSLVNKINQDTIAALKAGEADKVSVLRMLSSELKNKKIDLGKDLANEDVLAVIRKEVKKRLDASATFADAGRTDLSEKENAEIAVLKEYLPAELSDEELQGLVDEAISQVGASTKSDMGKVMGALQEKVGGRADGGRVAAMVQSKLS